MTGEPNRHLRHRLLIGFRVAILLLGLTALYFAALTWWTDYDAFWNSLKLGEPAAIFFAIAPFFFASYVIERLIEEVPRVRKLRRGTPSERANPRLRGGADGAPRVAPASVSVSKREDAVDQDPTDSREFAERGAAWYEALRDELEKTSRGKVVVINVGTGEYVVGDDQTADREFARRFPNTPGYAVTVGRRVFA